MSKKLIVNNLKKQYSNFYAVKGIDFDIKKGESLALLGTNGAGKSTTLKMIYNASKITSGGVKINGLDVQTETKKTKKIIGIVSQEDLLDLSLTVFENLIAHGICYGIPKSEVKKRALKLLSFVELQNNIHQEIDKLSGGMRRRVVLARALINNPELIILDEPTTGLDIQSRHIIWNKLLELKESGVSILLTSHYMDEVERLSDRVLIMDRGKIVAGGTKNELLDVYQETSLEHVFLKVTNGGEKCNA